ncbi:RluA family pseudouridine synthase [Brevundimonas sp. SORGH_AS_0993]|uniref:RluA family pseudouridine synthase n=1 Tax=Brevundimonas sp. SORGH_AS_0993 TaxID=3041794 RepID=UPI00277E2F8B|nr:23S rRNA pseudouridine1911/1915/1917 synthase [Brevundimonas sp. SORGH_AS_0993]
MIHRFIEIPYAPAPLSTVIASSRKRPVVLGRAVADPDLIDDEDAPLDAGLNEQSGERLEARLASPGVRLDKALADVFPPLSRARLQALLAQGCVSRDGQVLTGGSAKALPGLYAVVVPAPAPATPQPESIPLTVLYEDADLIVVDKPAGMAAHPAPGCETGTLVNALLAHCGDSLSGIGGVARPGIVHRLDKDTSGVMVAAKTDRAHAGLSALFAAHDIERTYIALTRGAPSPASGRIETRIGRSTGDRKKMAVLKAGGREAVTDYVVQQTFGEPARAGGAPMAARVACTLHTGRTHQIRVHMASKGAPILGDAVYGSGSPAAPVRTAIAGAGLTRQALHAAVLGFVHPVTGERLRFETAPPQDMLRLQSLLADL